MRELFTEPEIVELGLNVALCVGVGRLSATWDMVEELPDRYRAPGEVTPWGGDDAVIVRQRWAILGACQISRTTM